MYKAVSIILPFVFLISCTSEKYYGSYHRDIPKYKDLWCEDDYMIINSETKDTIYRTFLICRDYQMYHYIRDDKYFQVSKPVTRDPDYLKDSNIFITKFQIEDDSIRMIDHLDLGNNNMAGSSKLSVDFEDNMVKILLDSIFFRIVDLNNMKIIK